MVEILEMEVTNEILGLSVKINDVVQLDPSNTDQAFGGCFLIVEEVADWGVSGYVPALRLALGDQQHKNGAIAPFRAKKGTYSVIGKAQWILEEQEEPDRKNTTDI